MDGSVETASNLRTHGHRLYQLSHFSLAMNSKVRHERSRSSPQLRWAANNRFDRIALCRTTSVLQRSEPGLSEGSVGIRSDTFGTLFKANGERKRQW